MTLPWSATLFALALITASAPRTFAPENRGPDKIWSAVVIATNVSEPTASPVALRPVSERLRRVLGYNQFEILGSATSEIDDRVERWLVPTKHFWLNVKARRTKSKEARGGYLLNLQLFHDRRPLVETEAKLAPDSPLIIRGPLHARGQILIVLQVQP